MFGPMETIQWAPFPNFFAAPSAQASGGGNAPAAKLPLARLPLCASAGCLIAENSYGGPLGVLQGPIREKMKNLMNI